MDIKLTEEQKILRSTIREFAGNEILPRATELDRSGKFPYDLVRKCADLNLMGVAIPEQWGGGGMDYVSYCIAVEEVSRCCGSTGVILSVNNSLVCDPLLEFGNDDQKERFLKPLAKGDKIGCFALTEPEAGSDAGNQKSTAVVDGNEYVLNGQKIFITNGEAADTVIVFMMTDKSKGVKGITAFIVEKGTPGFSLGQKDDKLGINASGTAELLFEDCRIPVEQRLGNESEGFKIAMKTLDGGRIGIAAQAVGIAQAALNEAIKYGRERKQFGKPIGSFQAISFMIADMATEIDAARLLTYRAAYTKDSGKRYSMEAAMAKLFASETAMKATTKGIQIHGGYGYMKDFPMERFFRDAKITEIYEGTSEIQRIVIASSILR
ncbi:acyl-CoA dehydrogenase [Acidobacteriota bacterium]